MEALPAETQRAFLGCAKLDFFRTGGWYLAGGTALALHVGHRESVDLDFFTPQKDFDALRIERLFVGEGEWTTTYSTEGTLYGVWRGAKMSFIAYPFFTPSPARVECGSVGLLVPDDIAAMKIIAISQRGKRRDFIDLYWYVTVGGGSLRETIRRATAQYPGQNHSVPHFLKSLVYFDDAEQDPMPKLFFKADWREVRSYFEREVPPLAKALLHME